jgi:hypothetical protein
MAFVFLRDRAPALMPYLLGFEVVDREEDGSRAIGIFGFKVSGEYYYVPAFFVNQQVKGMDLLFAKKTNTFVPLRETWINHLLDKSTMQLGEGNKSKRIREDFENPNFDFLSTPPGTAKLASAGLGYLFTQEELRKLGQISTPSQVAAQSALTGGTTTTQQSNGKQDKQNPNVVGQATGIMPAGVVPSGNVASMPNSQLMPGNVTGQQPQFAKASGSDERGKRDGTGPFKDSYQKRKHDKGKRQLAGEECVVEKRVETVKDAWHAGRGHEAWNDLQGAVADSMAKDAAFQMDWAGFIAALNKQTLDDWHKTADGSPLLDYIAHHGGPLAARTLMRAMGNVKFANAALLFYPSVESLYVHEFDQSLLPTKRAATVSVVASGDMDDMVEGMSDDERKRLARDSFAIVDRREPDAKSEVFDAAYATQYSNPTISGTYNLLLPSGSTAKAWVLQPAGNQPGNSVIAVEPTNRFYFTADTSRIFVRGDAVEDDGPYAKAIDMDAIQPDSRYVLVNAKGAATAPFRVEAVVAENGERTRIRVYFDTDVTHERSKSDMFPDIPYPYIETSRTKYLQLTDDNSMNLRQSADNLIVSKAWKALRLLDKYDYIRECNPCADSSAARATAENAYDAFTPGDPIDLEAAFGKHAIHRMTVEAADQGATYYCYFDGYTDGPWNRKQAMVNLVTKYGMSVEDAEGTMLDAEVNTKSRKLLKMAQGVGVGINMPQDPGFSGSDPDTGQLIQEPYQGTTTGELLGAPPLADTLQPGYAVGGQTEHEISGGGGGQDIGAEAISLAAQAAQSGQKNVFDHATIGGLAHLYDASAVIDQYVPKLLESLDHIGRILFIFYWKNEDFAERYGNEDLAEMEDMFRGVFKSFGDMVLKLKQKSVGSSGNKDVLAI